MAPAAPTPYLERVLYIERKTQRTVGIEVDENAAAGKYNMQADCLLFSKLPRELRDYIWAYSTAPYEDTNGPFEKTAYYYRPDHTARLKTETAVLRTCRRVWLEANALPMLQAEHSFYYRRPAPDARNPDWMAKLTSYNRQNFGHLHLFVQMFVIESLDERAGSLREYFLRSPAVPGDFQPRMLHVTIRHTDFWHWESDEPLRLEDSWVQALLNSPDLRSTEILKLELETLDYKVPQLLPILDRLKRLESKALQTHIIDGKPAHTRFILCGEPKVYNWEGPTNINKRAFDPYAGKSTLKYHVATLTWKLSFQDIPRAFVAELRRAPRVGPLPDTAVDRQDHIEGLPYLEHMPSFPRPRSGIRPRWRTHHVIYSQSLERQVRQLSATQAERIEKQRRQVIDEWNAKSSTRIWQARWEDEKSLLRFIGNIEQEI